MIKFKELSRKQKWGMLFNIFLYGAFIIFMIYTIINSKEVSSKIFYSILLIIMISIAFYYEYLNYLKISIINALNNHYDLAMAKKLLTKMQKLDFINGFKSFYLIVDLQLAESEHQGQTLLNLVKANDKALRANLDGLLMHHYYTFIGDVLINNHNQIKKAYNNLINLKNAKIKKSKMSPLFNWDFIDCVFYLKTNDRKKAIKAYQTINPMYMNLRERKQYENLGAYLNYEN